MRVCALAPALPQTRKPPPPPPAGPQLKANTFLPYSYVRDLASVALLPGSTRVLNRTSGALVPCTSVAICPYATEAVTAPDGSQLLVNRAPMLALATVSMVRCAPAGRTYGAVPYCVLHCGPVTSGGSMRVLQHEYRRPPGRVCCVGWCP